MAQNKRLNFLIATLPLKKILGIFQTLVVYFYST